MAAAGKKVTVFAAGCFNRLHLAHRRLLREARALGDELVVVLSNDAHNCKPNAVPAELRRSRLEALGAADRVLIGRADGFATSLREIKPDILLLGYDQRLPDAETEAAVKELGIKVMVMPWYPGKEQDWVVIKEGGA
ncbi:MAG: adenylyltransferase/cytidyltransferase family protein [Elusimicrobia bacterium]|nr:adenylyltransferase/cytidyltransferase family protein [Elusimicrobiota bacterium]MDE2424948.1 adenylyltransferase/cytidyltransferase family protein [Elusimicrobiota bacterium]